MQLPQGVTEEDFLAAVEQVMDRIVPQFRHAFGVSVGEEDIRQQGMVFAIELMAKGTYTPGLPLVSYIYRHVRNRTINQVRDQVHRSDPPCKSCHAGQHCRPDGTVCKTYEQWRRRQHAKANLMRPERLALDRHPEREKATSTDLVVDDVQGCELSQLIDEQLPVELRPFYLMMLAGVPVSTSQRLAVQKAVSEIMGESMATAKVFETDKPEKPVTVSMGGVKPHEPEAKGVEPKNGVVIDTLVDERLTVFSPSVR